MPYRCVQNQRLSMIVRCLGVVVLAVVIAGANAQAREGNTIETVANWEGWRTKSIVLDGAWEACAGPLNDDYAAMLSGERMWQSVAVPSRQWPTDGLNDAPAVWARRTVVLPDNFAGYEGVLHWGRVHWGAEAWVNGVAVGESPVTCPHDVFLPAGLLRPGANLVVLRIGGWPSVPKSNGIPLIPAGYPDFGGPRPGAIFGDVRLDFYRWRYSGAMIGDLAMIADVLARSGDTELHTYSTSDGLSCGPSPTTGGPKSLSLVIDHYLKYVVPSITRYGTDKAAQNGRIEFRIDAKEEVDGGSESVTDNYLVAANLWYKNALWKSIFLRRANGAPQYPAGPAYPGEYCWMGPCAKWPGFLFMFGQMEGKVDPYGLSSDESGAFKPD